MKIAKATIHEISMALKKPFRTSLGTVTERRGLVLELHDENGLTGLGEGVAFSEPWYTEETVDTSLLMLKKYLLPALLQEDLHHPEEAERVYATVRGNPMAKAAVDMALWDLHARQARKPLYEIIGGTRKTALAGVAIGSQSIDDLLDQAQEAVREGYSRVKVKIMPGYDLEPLKALREAFPDLSILADANSAYEGKESDLLALDELGLQMIEQPLSQKDLVRHAELQKKLKTPVCLDESIDSYKAAANAIALNSCRVINIKIGRVGGLTEALKIVRLCQDHHIQVWCGGMLEFGISRAHNVALSTLKEFNIPGDLSSSSRYWEEDIATPDVIVKSGEIERFEGYGIGVSLNHKRLQEVTLHSFDIKKH
ncbi:o-succinylbenzoate synthase [Jeotgalibacillus sp. R-1-5s-1]|uniref:o-succinylbenzoate synthase n=1 Tax=Jeotgalibacillus sp. R-1-5s-1 TaxID=2555897 RepID=UPI00106DB8E7|nr:o-succinylbenzoate synthase [Jeotgalibacillus sp. R-1-5s-1]TFD98146.1 o-succinylbenzoate synthase [Jeotgalibacillus sp. R-1-5s-1]